MKSTATAAGLAACFSMIVLASTGAPAPAVAQDVQVSSADPASAPQGTVNLNVTIKGKGFKRGAVSRFFVTQTPNPGGIQVNSTSFVSPGELVANINIADAATIASFDIEVQNADGRTGKGTELFAVTAPTASGGPAAEIPVTVVFRDGTDRIQSDGQGAYSHGTDAVRAVFVANGNLFMKTNDSSKPAVRRLFFDFTQPVSTGNPPFATGTQQGYLSTSCPDAGGLRDMSIGASQVCNLGVHFTVPGTGTQWFVRFGAYSDTNPATVSRIDGATWQVEVLLPAAGKLLSAPTKGRLVLTEQGNFYMPVMLSVTLLE